MKFAVVFNHPYEDSYCGAILSAVERGIKKAGHDADIINLDKDKFNPVMTAEDLLAFKNKKAVDKQSIDYIERIRQADHLVFIFPIWWELMPALMKGFIDKVIFPGEIYDFKDSGFKMYSLAKNIKSATVITTMNAPSIIYKLIFGNVIKHALIKGTLKKTGIKNVKWISLDLVKSRPNQKREKWLAQIENRFSSYNLI